MPTCSFCRKSYKEPRGLTVYTFDGKAVHYCSSKCRKNTNLGRDGRKMKWVNSHPKYLDASSGDSEERSKDQNEKVSEKK
jgi:large subunit ribosomal protein L24e